MTPRETMWEVHAAKKCEEDDADRQIVLAWQIERVRVLSHNAAQRHQPMPALKTVLMKGQLGASRAEQIGLAEQLAATFPGSVRIRVKAA